MITSEPTLDDLKNGVDIVEYIGRHADVKKRGKEYVCCCPLHGEKTPSMYVNESKQLFHCYGCGAGGSVMDFIMQLYGLDEYGAVQQLKGELGIIAGQPIEKIERKLTDEQEKAQTLLSSCTLETPCGALFQYGIVLPSGYERMCANPKAGQQNEPDEIGVLHIPLRSSRGLDDVFILDSGRGRQLNGHTGDAWHTVGHYDEHSPSLYLCPDYIDATYLHKQTGGNRLIIFAANIYRAIERAKREHQGKQIRLALPNTTESEIILETWDGLYTMPAERGHWCEKDRRQEIKGIKKA